MTPSPFPLSVAGIANTDWPHLAQGQTHLLFLLEERSQVGAFSGRLEVDGCCRLNDTSLRIEPQAQRRHGNVEGACW